VIVHMKRRNFWIMFFGDILLILFSYYFAYYLRFEGAIPANEVSNFMLTVMWIVPVKLIGLIFFDLYKGMWRYTSLHDLINLIKGCVASSSIIMVVLLISTRFIGFPRSVFIIDFVLTFLLLGGYRLGIRLYYQHKSNSERPFFDASGNSYKRLLIVGAGDASEKLLREIRENRNLRYDVVGLLDDDLSRLRKRSS